MFFHTFPKVAHLAVVTVQPAEDLQELLPFTRSGATKTKNPRPDTKSIKYRLFKDGNPQDKWFIWNNPQFNWVGFHPKKIYPIYSQVYFISHP